MSQSTGTLKQRLGRHGVWDVALRAEDPARRGEQEDAAAELEELDFGAIWLGGNSTAANATPLIEATHHITVGTSIQSVWQRDAATTAADFARLESSQPGRFLLGLGVSHGPRVEGYHRPYSAMVDYLDALDKAGVPVGRRVLAALGPKMLQLAGDRAAGAIPYLVTPEHTAQAREILGQGPLLAPEFKVVLEQNPTRAREIARAYLARYLELPNYTDNFLRLGFDESDVTGGGSDRLIDAVFAWGDDDRIRRRVHAFHEAGADHVALQVVTEETGRTIPREQWRRLALLLR
ncbi:MULTISPECIES: LLM class F420-dependent oxidoreductase [Streptomyces]|uniref:LLM class F420-dependent oxidoreductase n=1 Tax=Streptomyces TaxID=1883 RepID=UPI000A3891C2|nr:MULTISPECIES: LLM class F420-dependent oxidoreductase [Streptomyces]MCE3033071.1 LLM class F420-dependent oxidoreductase [Streptomyces sp. CMSTAAHL-2]